MLINIGKGMSFDITPENIATMESFENVKARVWTIGLRNIIMDSHASIVSEDFKTEIEWHAASRVAAEKTLAALLAGESRVARERAPRADDFTIAMRKYVIGLVSKDGRKKLAAQADKGVAWIDGHFAKNEADLRPKIESAMAEAARLAAEKAKLAIDVDL